MRLCFALTSTLFSLGAVAAEKQPQISEPLSLQSSLNMFWGLLLVLAVIFALVYLLRRLGFARYALDGPIKVIHGVQLGQREKLLLVEVSGEQLLLSVTAAEIRKLHKLKTPVDIHWQEKKKHKGGFEQVIGTLLEKKKTDSSRSE